MHKKRTNNIINILLLIFAIIAVSLFTLISMILFLKSINPQNHEKKLLVSYNSEDNLSYKITTSENSFYSDDDLAMNRQYISSIIDKIYFTINYDYESSKLLDYNYDYSIIATLYSNYDNKELWSKEYVIEPSITLEATNTNNITINKNFEIDYQDYNNIMKQFQEEFNLDVNAYLSIDFKANIKGLEYSNNDIKVDDSINIRIPLLKETTYITYETTGIINNNIWTTKVLEEHQSIFLIILYGLGFIIGIVLDSILFYRIYQITAKDDYFVKINKIMKKYDDILVNIEDVPDYTNMKLFKVTNYKDLFDVSDKFRLPILYMEVKNKVLFFVINNDECYSYILKREDLIK